jgi:hypothetical protein
MRSLLLVLSLACTCAEDPAPQGAEPEPLAGATPADRVMAPEPGPAVRMDITGAVHIDGEPLGEGSQLLMAHPSLSWAQVSPVMAPLSEAPGPGFVRVGVADGSIELGWWTVHPGQVSRPDRGLKQTPLTLTLDLRRTGLQLAGFDLDSPAKAIEMVQASVQTAPGRTVPVLLRVEPEFSWGQLLELAISLDEVIGAGRVAIWHIPLEAP